MKKYIIITLFFSVFNIAYAQMVIPGYQGKRFSAELNFTPMAVGPTAEGVGGGSQNGFKNQKGLGLSLRYDLSLNYAVSRQYSLTLDYATGQTGVFTTTSNGYDEFAILHKVNFNHIGFGYNGFAKHAGGLAPIGNYFSIKVLYINAQTERYKIAPIRNLNYTNITEPVLLTPDLEKQFPNLAAPSAEMLNFKIGFGTRRILSKHLFFNFSTFGGLCVNLKPIVSYRDAQA